MLPGTYREDDAYGVRHDTLVDARGNLRSYKAQLEDMYVTLDALADDREGVWTDDEREELRQMQRTIRTLVEVCETNLADIDDELTEMTTDE